MSQISAGTYKQNVTTVIGWSYYKVLQEKKIYLDQLLTTYYIYTKSILSLHISRTKSIYFLLR